jgi:hypothetical protein
MKVPSLDYRSREYKALHAWLNKHKGKAFFCKKCGLWDTKKRYEWSNISGEYKRDLKDYESLCTSCHRKKDYYNENKEGRMYKWLMYY